MSTKELEQSKYERMWAHNNYRNNSPAYHEFFDEITAIIKPGDSVIEFGCGTAFGLAEIGKTHEVLGIDIARNCLSVDVPFEQACIWEPMAARADVGFCVDVMEHIPTDKVEDVIREIMQCVPKCLFIAALFHDNMGKLIGETLHLTVKPAEWWHEIAAKYGKVSNIHGDWRATHFTLTAND